MSKATLTIRPRQPVKARHSSEGGADQTENGKTSISHIVAQFEATGIPPKVAFSEPLYGDFSDAEALHSAMNRVKAAQAEFDALPARLRRAAENNPVQFLAMVQDSDGIEILREAGLEIEGAPEPPSPSLPPEEPPAPSAEPTPESGKA